MAMSRLYRIAIGILVWTTAAQTHSSLIDSYSNSNKGRTEDAVTASQTISPQVEQAIARSRQHLASHHTSGDSPFAFPMTRYRLGLMLESITPNASTEGQSDEEHYQETKKEILRLYEAVAQNKTHTDLTVRVDALQRTSELLSSSDPNLAQDALLKALRQILEVPQPESAFNLQQAASQATAVELFTAVFQRLIVTLPPHSYTVSSMSSSPVSSLLEICQNAAVQWPFEPSVREHRGILFRKIGAPSYSAVDVAQEYDQAARLLHLQIFSEKTPYGTVDKILETTLHVINKEDMENELERLSALMASLLRYITLAACSAREAKLLEEESFHFAYGLRLIEQLHVESQDGPSMIERATTKSVRLDATDAVDFWVNVGIAYKKRGDMNQARVYFRRALDQKPDDGHALVQLASLGDDDVMTNTTCLSNEYVSGLFDGYSSRFEDELVNVLEYQGHILVIEALLRHTNLKRKTEEMVVVIDLGCGTGLAGAQLIKERPDLSVRGVDLAARMVEISRQRSVYESVTQASALKYLQAQASHSVHAIVASDVFIYVGALEDILAECVRVLGKRKSESIGIVSFTVESPPILSDDGPGVVLLQSGRFGHTKNYIAQVATDVGFELVEWTPCVLRKQAGKEVAGATVVLKVEI